MSFIIATFLLVSDTFLITPNDPDQDSKTYLLHTGSDRDKDFSMGCWKGLEPFRKPDAPDCVIKCVKKAWVQRCDPEGD